METRIRIAIAAALFIVSASTLILAEDRTDVTVRGRIEEIMEVSPLRITIKVNGQTRRVQLLASTKIMDGSGEKRPEDLKEGTLIRVEGYIQNQMRIIFAKSILIGDK